MTESTCADGVKDLAILIIAQTTRFERETRRYVSRPTIAQDKKPYRCNTTNFSESNHLFAYRISRENCHTSRYKKLECLLILFIYLL